MKAPDPVRFVKAPVKTSSSALGYRNLQGLTDLLKGYLVRSDDENFNSLISMISFDVLQGLQQHVAKYRRGEFLNQKLREHIVARQTVAVLPFLVKTTDGPVLRQYQLQEFHSKPVQDKVDLLVNKQVPLEMAVQNLTVREFVALQEAVYTTKVGMREGSQEPYQNLLDQLRPKIVEQVQKELPNMQNQDVFDLLTTVENGNGYQGLSRSAQNILEVEAVSRTKRLLEVLTRMYAESSARISTITRYIQRLSARELSYLQAIAKGSAFEEILANELNSRASELISNLRMLPVGGVLDEKLQKLVVEFYRLKRARSPLFAKVFGSYIADIESLLAAKKISRDDFVRWVDTPRIPSGFENRMMMDPIVTFHESTRTSVKPITGSDSISRARRGQRRRL